MFDEDLHINTPLHTRDYITKPQLTLEQFLLCNRLHYIKQKECPRITLCSPCAPAEARWWFFLLFRREVWGKFGGNFVGFFRPTELRAQKNRGKFRSIFRKRICSSKKIVRAKFTLQTCQLNLSNVIICVLMVLTVVFGSFFGWAYVVPELVAFFFAYNIGSCLRAVELFNLQLHWEFIAPTVVFVCVGNKIREN